jgi:glycolate oxidase
MMDRPAIHAVEEFVHAGYPLDAEALLIIEADGPGAEVDYLVERIETIAKSCGAGTCRISQSEQERLLLWAGRKAAFPAVGRISPDYYCMDGTIPRARLPQVLARMREMSERHGLALANVFHADRLFGFRPRKRTESCAPAFTAASARQPVRPTCCSGMSSIHRAGAST